MIEKIKHGTAVPFTQVSNAILTDKTLSLKAKGLLAYMLSKPEDWAFNVRSMGAELEENKDTVARILKTLIDAGYVRRREIREGGQVKGYEYSVYQSPCLENEDRVDSPCLEKPCLDSPCPKNEDTPNKELQTKKYKERGRGKRKSETYEHLKSLSALHNPALSISQRDEEAYKGVAAKHGAEVADKILSETWQRAPGKAVVYAFSNYNWNEIHKPPVKFHETRQCPSCGRRGGPGDFVGDVCAVCDAEAQGQSPDFEALHQAAGVML